MKMKNENNDKKRKICCVPGCESKTKTISFPKYPPLLKQWLRPFREHISPDWAPRKSDGICPKHFRSCDLHNHNPCAAKSAAIPCNFPWKTKRSKKKSKKSETGDVKHRVVQKEEVCLTRESVEKALQIISGEIPIEKFTRKQHMVKCNPNKDSVGSEINNSMLSTDLLMKLLRRHLLHHNWDGVVAVLPKLFNKHCEPYIWKIALQVMCHHPRSSPHLLQDFLQTCLRTNYVSPDLLRKIFCTPSIEEIQESKSNVLFKRTEQ